MRQITFYEFECGTEAFVQAEDGRYDVVRTPITTITDSSVTRSEVRKAIKDAGYDLKRGERVYSTAIYKIVYRFETEDLIAIAKERIVEPIA